MEQFAYVLVTKSHEESYKELDESIMEYLTFGAYVQALGGWHWRPAVLGAKLAFIRASRMGGKWIFRDQATSLLCAARVMPRFMSVTEKKWSRFTMFHNDHMKAQTQVAIEDTSGLPAITDSSTVVSTAVIPTETPTAKAKA